jgi:hypothetical protein
MSFIVAKSIFQSGVNSQLTLSALYRKPLTMHGYTTMMDGDSGFV